MKNTKYARVGEIVQLVEPYTFVRCGYPLCVKDIIEKEKSNIEAMILEIIRSWQPKVPGVFATSEYSHLSGRTHGMLVAAIASYKLEQQGYGGKERSIHEQKITNHILGNYVVIGKNFHKTGIRYSPSSWTSYEGEYDYEPGGLENEKTHCVYTLKGLYNNFKVLSTRCKRI